MANKPQTTDTSKTAKGDPDSAAPTSKRWTFLAFAIPAYTYFFGYCSKKYFLDGLGFENPDISSDPGPVYEFAFNSFFFTNSEALKNAWPMFFNLVNDSWIYIIVISVGAGIISFFLFGYIMKKTISDSKNAKEKNQPDRLWISIIITGGSISLNFLMIPIVIWGMTLVSITFMPAAVIGYAMAGKEISEFTCEVEEDRKSKLTPCTTVLLDDGTERVGNIYHVDSNYLYIFTSDGAESIPIESIKSRKRALLEKADVAADSAK